MISRRVCNPERPTRVAASNSTRPASSSSSAFLMRTSTTYSLLLHLLLPSVSLSLRAPIVSILMRVMFIPRTFYQEYIHEFVEMSVLVLEPEVRACSVVSSRSSSLFCTMTSVYFCFFLHILYIFLFIPLAFILSFYPSLPYHSFASHPSLPPCCRECASPLAKLNHFHS